MTTAVQTKEKPEAVPEVQKPKMISVANVTINQDGFAFRSIAVRLPVGMTADDLRSAGIWTMVQGNPGKSLRRHDHLYLIGFTDDWAVEALVTDANAMDATIAIQKVISFESKTKSLFKDDTYSVEWNGSGFYVRRVKDGQSVTSPVHTEELAIRDLRQLYPRRVAMNG